MTRAQEPHCDGRAPDIAGLARGSRCYSRGDGEHRLLIQERTRHANRLHKVLEDAGIKLTSVATHLLGTSGRAMLDALVVGTTDPPVLADLARGKLRKKLPALRQALVGRFRAHHAFFVSQLLAHLDYLECNAHALAAKLLGQAAAVAVVGHTTGQLAGRPSRLDLDSPYLLGGIARCGVCEGAIIAMTRAHGKGKRAHFYGCAFHHKRGGTICRNAVQRAYERLEKRPSSPGWLGSGPMQKSPTP
jgi:Recombinase zinc beta ribbon domain